MDKKRQSILKQEGRIPLQEVLLPDFPDDDTATVTVTKSRRVSFGANVIKEFIVGSAVSAQFYSEYEQPVSSSDSSRSGLLDQSTFQNDGVALNLCTNKSEIDEELMPLRKKYCLDKSQNARSEVYDRNNDKKWEFNVNNTSNIFANNASKNSTVTNKADFKGSGVKFNKKLSQLNDSFIAAEKHFQNKHNDSELNNSKVNDNSEKKSKQGKFSSTICFSADSPTADMEFTEGCISLAKSIFDKKKKEMTVYIQGKPKEANKEEKDSNDTIFFEASDVEMSLTKCVQDNSDSLIDEKAEMSFTKCMDDHTKTERVEMSLTKCVEDDSDTDETEDLPKCFQIPPSANFCDSFNDSNEDIENVPPRTYPMNLVLGQGDESEDDAEIERSLFFPERSLTEMLNGDPLKTSMFNDESSLNEDDKEECDMDITACDPLKISVCDETPGNPDDRDWSEKAVTSEPSFNPSSKSPISDVRPMLEEKIKDSEEEMANEADPLQLSMADVNLTNDECVVQMLSADRLKLLPYSESLVDDNDNEECDMEITDVGKSYLLKANLLESDNTVENMENRETLCRVGQLEERGKTSVNEGPDDRYVNPFESGLEERETAELPKFVGRTGEAGECEKASIDKEEPGERYFTPFEPELEERKIQGQLESVDKIGECGQFREVSMSEEKPEEKRASPFELEHERIEIQEQSESISKIGEFEKLVETSMNEGKQEDKYESSPVSEPEQEEIQEESRDVEGKGFEKFGETSMSVRGQEGRYEENPSGYEPLQKEIQELLGVCGSEEFEKYGETSINEEGLEDSRASPLEPGQGKAEIQEYFERVGKRDGFEKCVEKSDTSLDVEKPEDGPLNPSESERGIQEVQEQSKRVDNNKGFEKCQEMSLPSMEIEESDDRCAGPCEPEREIQEQSERFNKNEDFEKCAETSLESMNVEEPEGRCADLCEPDREGGEIQEQSERFDKNEEFQECGETSMASMDVEEPEDICVDPSEPGHEKSEIQQRPERFDINEEFQKCGETSIASMDVEEPEDICVDPSKPGHEKSEIQQQPERFDINEEFQKCGETSMASMDVEEPEDICVDPSKPGHEKSEIQQQPERFDINEEFQKCGETSMASMDVEEPEDICADPCEPDHEESEIQQQSESVRKSEFEECKKALMKRKVPDDRRPSFVEPELTGRTQEPLENARSFKRVSGITDDLEESLLKSFSSEEIEKSCFPDMTQYEESFSLCPSESLEPCTTSQGDKKITILLREQSEEPNCCWKMDNFNYSEGNNYWSFSFILLDSSAVVKFKLKPPKDAFIDSFSCILDQSIELSKDQKYRSEKEKVAINFAFGKLKNYFERESRGLDNVHKIPLFLDSMNLFLKKINRILKQIIKIMKEYPGSRLKGSILSFRLYSYPLMFSCSVLVNVSDPLHMSENSISVKKHFGNFSTTMIKSIFKSCLNSEEVLTQFIRTLTQFVISKECEGGSVTNRSHIRLIV